MGKSVYSIVLQDEVVAAVDAMAYQQGISRSALMNRLLAQAVSYVTPEQRMQGIFDALQEALAPLPQFQLMETASDAMCRLTSALRYKYNPVVRYGVELYHREHAASGMLKASLRSQSAALLQKMDGFFHLWNTLEDEVLEEIYPRGVPCRIGLGRYEREFHFPAETEQLSTQEMGDRIAAYIQVFDGAMKSFFAQEDTVASENAAAEYYLHAAPKLFEMEIF